MEKNQPILGSLYIPHRDVLTARELDTLLPHAMNQQDAVSAPRRVTYGQTVRLSLSILNIKVLIRSKNA